jgi:hypothetical protein
MALVTCPRCGGIARLVGFGTQREYRCFACDHLFAAGEPPLPTPPRAPWAALGVGIWLAAVLMLPVLILAAMLWRAWGQ